MAHAAVTLNMHFSTFKRYAVKYDCYIPNQAGKGIRKKTNGHFIPLDDIIVKCKHPQYSTNKLKHRLYKSGLKYNICECCGVCEWQGKKLVCELDHIDGDRTNHNLKNLRILCPNCHSQTDTFRNKQGTKYKRD
jgi:hypothetical protein